VGKDSISLLAQMMVAGMSSVVSKTNELTPGRLRLMDGTPSVPTDNPIMKLLVAWFRRRLKSSSMVGLLSFAVSVSGVLPPVCRSHSTSGLTVA
jgi:hypothetical protein